ncbi:MAG: PEP-CTERM system TPR-repeat protein PrsT [Gammaproteobacteria bacterium]|nr:PEP-CTERM system TPR-repeat protein PrsT [Gammaproteobacteria bacterium]
MERAKRSDPATADADRLHDWLTWAITALLVVCGVGWWWWTSDTVVQFSSQEHLDRAREFRLKDNVRAAIVEYQNAIQKEPHQPELRAELGLLHLELGALSPALKELRQAERLGDKSPDIALGIVKGLLGAGRYKEALVSLEVPALAGKQFFVEVSLLTAQAWVGLGEHDRGRDIYQEILQAHPNTASAFIGLARLLLAGGQTAEADALVARATQIDPTYVPAHIQQGANALAKRDFEAAEAAYASAVQLSPRNVGALIGLSRALVAQQKHDAAREHLKVLDRYAPGHIAVIFLKALVARRDFDNQAAISGLKLVLRQDPDHFPAMLLLGSIQHESGELASSLSLLTRFIRAYPKHVYALRRLAGVQIEMGLFEDAAAKLVRVLEVEPRNLEVLNLLGQLYSEQSRYQVARDYFEQAVLLEPDDATMRTYLGISEISSGSVDSGIEQLEAARQASKQTLTADVLLFFAKMKAGQNEDALATALALIEQRPHESAYYNLAGIAQEALGDAGTAQTYYEKAVAINDDDSSAEMNLGRLHRRRGNIDEAQARYQSVKADAAPGSEPYTGSSIALAEIAEQKGDPELAREQYASVLEFDEGNVPAAIGLASLADGAGDTARGKALLELTRAKNPDALEPRLALIERYRRDEDWEMLLPVAEEAKALVPRDPGVLRILGEARARNGLLEEAVQIYERLTELAPDVGDAHYRLGSVLMLRREVSKARGKFERAVQLDSSHVAARLALGSVALFENDVQEARGHLRKAREGGGDIHGSMVLEGDIQLVMGDTAEAIRSYKRAQSQLLSPAVVVKLHAAQRKIGEEKQALETLEGWLAKHPNSIPILELAARAALEQSDLEGASKHFEEILKIKPRHARTLNNLAWFYFDQGDDRAMTFAQRAHRAEPTNSQYLFTIGWMTVTLGDVEVGLQYLRQAVRESPDDTNLRLRLSEALIEHERPVEARKQIDIVLASEAPAAHHESARSLLGKILEAG